MKENNHASCKSIHTENIHMYAHSHIACTQQSQGGWFTDAVAEGTKLPPYRACSQARVLYPCPDWVEGMPGVMCDVSVLCV